jgi:DNA-binding transcriptional LysR family regulator
MTNIPTDLLRTFVSVVELRSFTRAAKAQGMTQPAVSAQIRRLQCLLGVELLDKSAPGVSLTPTGEQVIESARRLLSVNDHIVEIATPNSASQLVRIGVRKDCMGGELEQMLVTARARWPNLRFAVSSAGQRRLLQYLKQDEVDLVVALLTDDPGDAPRHCWPEQLVWVRGQKTALDLKQPIPLVAGRDRCLSHRNAVAILAKAGLASELVFRADTAEALRSAVAAGVGVMLLARGRIPAELDAWDDGPLPPPPIAYSGIYVREGSSALLEQLADDLAATLRPPAVGAGLTRLATTRASASERSCLSV